MVGQAPRDCACASHPGDNPNAWQAISNDIDAPGSDKERAVKLIEGRKITVHEAAGQTSDGRGLCWSQSAAARAYPDPDDEAVIAHIRATVKRWRADMQQQLRILTEE
jgi:hypothetical protein